MVIILSIIFLVVAWIISMIAGVVVSVLSILLPFLLIIWLVAFICKLLFKKSDITKISKKNGWNERLFMDNGTKAKETK